MAPELHQLNLESAWARVKFDLSRRVFINPTMEQEIIDCGLGEWLAALRSNLEAGIELPHACEVIDVPKAGFHIRPGAHLDVRDQIIYLAILQEMYPKIREFLRTTHTPKDYAYLLRGSADVPWFQQPPIGGWRAFQRASMDKMNAGSTHVLLADLAGFYENIDLGRLQYVLNSLGLDENLLTHLFRYLRVWAEPRGRGIPQGLSGSDLLSKVYLESIDRRLERDGFDHVRYVDDIRIFAKSELEAKKALIRLTALLREVGLNLQTKKTYILPTEEARASLEGSIPEIEALRDELTRAVREEGFSNPYLTVEDFADLRDEQAAVAQEALERSFVIHFEHQTDHFDSSLLHYLLIRLGRIKSRVALDFAFKLLSSHPEETKYALDYLASFKDDGPLMSRIAQFAISSDAIYDYQIYQILRWLVKEHVSFDESLRLSRRILSDRSKPSWVRSEAVAFLGEHGDAADFESIEAQFPQAQSDLERAILLAALRRMNRARRNGIYARYGAGSMLASNAVAWARQSVH